jgi:hypothetical protein
MTKPNGKLYVPAARLVHVASADDHELTDPEISGTPDFSNTYPPQHLRDGARLEPVE